MLPDLIPGRIRDRILVCDDGRTTNGTVCWKWQGSDSGTGRGGGYGRVSYRGRTWAVHRLIYKLVVGRLLEPARQLDHQCENRRCCNPGHVAVCSNRTNNRLRVARTKRRARNEAEITL